MAGRAQQPKWFTPFRLLIIFCITNLFVYLDRGLVSSNGVNGSPRTEQLPDGSGIQGEFDLTFFQDGLLAPAFLVGLLIASPIFAEASKTYSAFRLLGIGMGVWTLACFVCGLSWGYWSLMACRAFVGVGEASFVALAAPFIDDYAPPAHKATWFATFYLCIPAGFALGYITGGLVGPTLGWRSAFMLEALAMTPFVLFALFAQPIYLQGKSRPSGSKSNEAEDACNEPLPWQSTTWGEYLQDFGLSVRTVVQQRVWLLACAGYTLYVAVMGVYAYWGPKAGKALFFGSDSKGEQADVVFGAVTVMTGVLGSIGGGLLLDRAGSTLRTASGICGLSCLLGLACVLPAFLVTKDFTSFMVAFALAQLVMFALQSPVVAIQMWSVPSLLRPLGTSLTTCTIHLLGDVPSPPLLGLLQTKLSEGLPAAEAAQVWRTSMSIISMLLLLAGAFFLAAAFCSTPDADFRVETQPQESARDEEQSEPLLRDAEDQVAEGSGGAQSG